MKRSTRQLVIMALLIALQIVLSRFLSVNTQLTKIGFAFVPVVLAGVFYGPVPAAVVGGLSDFLGATLFPIGPYFPGFTLTAVAAGLVYGLLLHKKPTLPRIILASAVSQLVLGLFVNTWWIHVLYGSDYWLSLTTTRLAQCLGMFPVEVAVMGALTPFIGMMERRELV